MKKTSRYYEMQMPAENEYTPVFGQYKDPDKLRSLYEEITDPIFTAFEDIYDRVLDLGTLQKICRPHRVRLAKIRLAYKHRLEVLEKARERGIIR